MIDDVLFSAIVDELRRAGFADGDIDWSENAGPPQSAEAFALEAAYVICNSGMKNTVARPIYERVRTALGEGRSAATAFGHPGKTLAIDGIWARRADLYRRYMACHDKLAFLAALPWIGAITKFHLAKNFGLDVAKPDVHLQRLADREGASVQALCARLAVASGWKARTVDLLLWRACAEGILDSRSGEFRPRAAA